MGFALVDDKLHSHPKWRQASKGARALWATSLSWCSSFPSGGHIPAHMLRTLEGTPAEAECLVRVGLWESADDGWSFHQWDERNPDAESARAALAAKSVGGKRGNHVKWHVKRGITVSGCPLCEEASDMRSHTDRTSESHERSHRIAPTPSPTPNPSDSPSVVGDGDQSQNVTYVPGESADVLDLAARRKENR